MQKNEHHNLTKIWSFRPKLSFRYQWVGSNTRRGRKLLLNSLECIRPIIFSSSFHNFISHLASKASQTFCFPKQHHTSSKWNTYYRRALENSTSSILIYYSPQKDRVSKITQILVWVNSAQFGSKIGIKCIRV